MNNTQSVTKTSNTRDYDALASKESIDKAIEAFKENNFIPYHVTSKEDALKKVIELIPEGATVMNGASETLREIGFVDYLKDSEHKWNNLHEVILAESDPEKQQLLRRESVVSDYYVGSVHAASENGELIIASNSGSQLPHIVFTSPNVIFVVGSQKIVKDLSDAVSRLKDHVIELEDKRMNEAYGMGTTHTKTVILHKENPMSGRKIHVILVDEKLGF